MNRESAHERALERTRRRKAIAGPAIKCAQCDGLGVHGLHPAHLVTWGALGADWRTTDDIRKRLGGNVQPTALINRLQQLRRWGLVEVRPSATNFKRYEWRRLP